MARVNVSDKVPTLSPKDYPENDVLAFTIAEVRHINQGGRERIILFSEEFGENAIWPNVTSLRTLVEKFGDNDTAWIGKTIPLVPVSGINPQTNQPSLTFWVAGTDNTDAWDAVSGEPAPKKRAAKRGKR